MGEFCAHVNYKIVLRSENKLYILLLSIKQSPWPHQLLINGPSSLKVTFQPWSHFVLAIQYQIVQILVAKTLANLANCKSFANILPTQIYLYFYKILDYCIKRSLVHA